MAIDLLGNKLPTYIDFKRFVGTFDLNGKLLLREQATPNTPPANTLYLYAKDKTGISTLYFKKDDGSETEVGAGGSMSIGGTVTSGTTGSVLFVGAGPVLAQDNANLFWDDANNRLGIGLATPANQLEIGSTITTAARGLSILQADASSAAPVIFTKKSRGTLTAPTAISSGDVLGNISFLGYGTSFVTSGTIRSVADEIFSGTAAGSHLEFFTTPTSSVTAAERFRIGPAGQWGIGGATFGTAGQVFTSGGASAAPTWATPSTGMSIGGTVTSGTTGSVLFIGAGPVLAQDNATFFWDTSNKRLGIGFALPLSQIDIGSTGSTANRGLGITQTSADTIAAALFFKKSRGTVLGSPAAITTSDVIGNVIYQGYGTSFVTGCFIRALADETWDGTHAGSHLEFATTPLASVTAAERFRIGNAGQLGIGGATFGTSGHALLSGGASAPPTWDSAGITTTITTASLVGKTITVTNGFITGFA